MSATILIVEDEPPLIEVLRYNLESEGFTTLIATDGEEALLLATEQSPNLIILDWMLPEMSGVDVCRRLRGHKETKSVPIIMLTARGEERDKIYGLDAGADDYVVKPFSPSELIARIRAILRRTNPDFFEDKLEYADITLDTLAHKVSRAGKAIHLGPTEFCLG
jgi:two-component system phosphate regulon response regulator PhoB